MPCGITEQSQETHTELSSEGPPRSLVQGAPAEKAGLLRDWFIGLTWVVWSGVVWCSFVTYSHLHREDKWVLICFFFFFCEALKEAFHWHPGEPERGCHCRGVLPLPLSQLFRIVIPHKRDLLLWQWTPRGKAGRMLQCQGAGPAALSHGTWPSTLATMPQPCAPLTCPLHTIALDFGLGSVFSGICSVTANSCLGSYEQSVFLL